MSAYTYDSLTGPSRARVDKVRKTFATCKQNKEQREGSRDIIMRLIDSTAKNHVTRARRSDAKAPEGAPWLDTALACNHATNIHLRRLIEARAHALYAMKEGAE